MCNLKFESNELCFGLLLFQNSISTPVTGVASIFGFNHVELNDDGDDGADDDDGDGDVEDNDDEEADYVLAEVSSHEVHLPKTNFASAAPAKKIPCKKNEKKIASKEK